jgi:DNA-binding SARP family transcriptional activator
MRRPRGETRICICGELAGTVGGRPLEAALRGRLGRLLFAYLVLNRDRAVTRGELVDRLWDESPPDSSATTLNSLLSRMRSGLGADVLQGRSTLRLMLPPDAWIDVEKARSWVAAAHAALERARPAEAFSRAREALAVLEQGLLVDVETRWLDEQRRELDELAIGALECVAAAGPRLGGAEAAEGAHAARAVIERAPYRETGYRLLMEALERRGNLAEALRVYEQCRALLGEELGATPGPELRQLHRRLLSEREPRRPTEEPVGGPLPPVLRQVGPYVGRGAERERLQRLWKTALGGRRSTR